MKIMIATPTAHDISPEYMKAVYETVIEAKAMFTSREIQVDFNFFRGYMVDMSRNQLSFEAIQGEYDYILFIDSDTILPHHALFDLLTFAITKKKGIVAGWQRRRQNYVGVTETFALTKGDGFDERFTEDYLKKQKQPFKIKGTGFGCVLIEVDILDTLFKEGVLPFKYIKYPDGTSLSEDLYFCHNVRKAMNEDIWLHPRVRCGHRWTDTF